MPEVREPWYEVWYAKLNSASSNEAFWLRLTTLAIPGGKHAAEIWGIYFNRKPDGTVVRRAGKATLPAAAAQLTPGGVRIQESFWDDERMETSGRAGSLAWDLRYRPGGSREPQRFSHVPKALSRLGLNRSTVVTPWPDLLFDGVIEVDGRKIHVTQAPGMQGHIFGSKSAESWAWAHANFGSGAAKFVFESLTARIRAGGVLLPPLSAFLFEWNGKRVEVNGLWESCRARSEVTDFSWVFKTSSGQYRFHGEITGKAGEFAGVRYEDTDGSSLYCHNSKISSMKLGIFEGDKLEAELHCSGACAFEIVSRAPDPRIEFLL